MAHNTSISYVGDKLIVGALDTSFLTATSRLTPGTAVLNGPVFIGANAQLGIARATCMIGPPIGLAVPASLEVTGVSNFLGPVTNIAGLLSVTAVSNFTGSVNINAVETKNGADLKNAINIGNDTGVFNGPAIFNSFVICDKTISCNNLIAAGRVQAQNGAFTTVAAPFKQFDIPHPNKKGMRLRHACIEGPEVGVYYRGKLENQNQIILPDYWNNLIDIETITVNLTPNNTYQELYVKNIEWGKVINIANNLSGPINCFYTVFAERKDVEKLVIEYEGDKIQQ